MSWPPNAVPGGTLVLNPNLHRGLVVPDIYLPDNFTIELPAVWPTNNGVPEPLNWVATNSLRFGRDCIIDLSPKTILTKPPKPATPDQAGMGARGTDGTAGKPGANGLSGVDLNLQVQTVVARGSLWINTSGGNGGEGATAATAAKGVGAAVIGSGLADQMAETGAMVGLAAAAGAAAVPRGSDFRSINSRHHSNCQLATACPTRVTRGAVPQCPPLPQTAESFRSTEASAAVGKGEWVVRVVLGARAITAAGSGPIELQETPALEEPMEL
jgi:hypothetical protein